MSRIMINEWDNGWKMAIFFLFASSSLTYVSAMAAPSHQFVNTTGLQHNFELICETKVNGDIPLMRYRSKATGLHVTIALVNGPLVNGYFTLATEAQDDDGLPHTLEHLVFLGSEDFPYKGVLDLLANRCLASGTNAWTDTDHTAYTVQNAGSEGFLNLLPIYMDHLLYPTLTDAAFITEVYHITGQGEDAGVVYSEMQSRENTDSDRSYRALQRALYPEPSGYSYETGGIMKNLRESTNNEKIRKFHGDFYRPENLHIIVTGQVQPSEIFAALEPVEKKILQKGERGEFTRPWSSSVPPLIASVDELIKYPSDTEETGLVMVAWRGPSAVQHYQELNSMAVLMEYLTHSSISPLPKVFVEIEDPFASKISHSCYENKESSCYFKFRGVPTDKVDQVKPRLMETLNKLTNGQQEIDMVVMNDILSNLILKQDSRLETSPHDTIADAVIGDILYGNTCQDLDIRMNKKHLYEDLLKQPVKYWYNLIEKYLLTSPSVTIRGVPSMAEAERLEQAETERLDARRKVLGEDGLKELDDKVIQAKETNEIPPPSEMLSSVPVPGVEKINFHSLRAYDNHVNLVAPTLPTINVNDPEEVPASLDLSQLSINFQLDDIQSNFVEMAAILDTSSLKENERSYLPLLLHLFFESPIQRGSVLIPYEEVVQDLSAQTLAHDGLMGLDLAGDSTSCGPYCTNAAIDLKVEMKQYEQGVTWMKEILFDTKFQCERIRIQTNKILNDLSDQKRRGSALLKLMYNDVTFKKNTNPNQINILRQQKFLTNLLERLNTEPSKVTSELEDIRCKITKPECITIHMATCVKKLSALIEPLQPWMNFLKIDDVPKEKMLTIIPDSILRSHESLDAISGYITGVGSVDSGYLLQTTACITEHTHWDIPALMTAIQYLTQLEGPMWKEIRGKGLSYTYSIILNPTEGTLNLNLKRSSQLPQAYTEALKILNCHINESDCWDINLLESARSSLIYEVIEREAVVSDVMQQSVLSYFRRVSHSYNRDLLTRIANVSLDDVKRVTKQYMKPLTKPNLSSVVIVTHPLKVQETASQLNEMGHNLQIVESLEDSRFG